MIFEAVDAVPGAWLITAEAHHDERGSMTRTYEAEAWAAHGLTTTIDHVAVSRNLAAATLRGLHLQVAPHGEAKTVRCTRGRIFDVLVDARPTSPTFGRWAGFELDESDDRSLHAPVGVAHGFVTLLPDTEVTYLISAGYVAEAAAGIRWDDPDLAITWPVEPEVLSDRDRHLPRLAEWATNLELP
ncbi:MAG: rfbC [Acidimicrobiales bacterium]|nr:rfbC [Acidimicrobiales bacterium]